MLNSAAAVVEPLLEPDERLIWSGQPRGGIRFELSDLFYVPFSLLWAGFAFFWNFAVWQSGGPLFARLFGIPFVLVGIYIVVGRFVYDALRRKNTYYALTNQRVMILTQLFSRKLQSIRIGLIDPISIDVGGNGVGTIAFGGPVAH